MITSIIPPKIIQAFSSKLLSTPSPELKDTPGQFLKVIEFIELKLKKKSIYGNRTEKYEKEFNEAKRLLTQLQEKENSLPEKKSKAQQSFYYVNLAKRSDNNLFFRFRQKAIFF